MRTKPIAYLLGTGVPHGPHPPLQPLSSGRHPDYFVKEILSDVLNSFDLAYFRPMSNVSFISKIIEKFIVSTLTSIVFFICLAIRRDHST